MQLRVINHLVLKAVTLTVLCLQIEDKISIGTLEELKSAFQNADADGTGKLELDEFKHLLRHQLQLSGSKVRITHLFM